MPSIYSTLSLSIFHFVISFALSSLLTAAPSLASKCRHRPDQLKCVKYVNNYDGDTITFDIKKIHPLLGNQISIRVAGVDTPEIRSSDACERAKAVEARNFVKIKLQQARRIHLKNVERGKYFRIVSDVELDGKLLKDELLEKRLAVPYDGGKKQIINWCD